jgi:hypothetical protein
MDKIPEWIGVDLDKTLAKYEQGDIDRCGPYFIGSPIMPMVARVKHMLAMGKTVKIFTARVSIGTPSEIACIEAVIQEWCREFIGKILEVTCVKDIGCMQIWDDRAISVEPNTGKILTEMKDEAS